ncbi:DUF58 domain-containing protein [Marinibacterium sp. SX1]|uniref:DUF58 domain-containing protein n=1 Tax=Marinibacterium sp. SX1 TaxID=3388424 RepID=UPI003D180EA7
MAVPPDIAEDPRIHVTARGLQRLAGAARDLRFLPRQPARSVLNGRHGSRLRGRGLNFEELRDYVDGDDIRTIDWKVTARTGSPHVRVYTEERDRPALLLVDQRVSMFFGSQVYMKSVIAAEAAALAAHRILAQGDRVGGLVFTDTTIAEHRPQRSAAALHRLLASTARANRGLSADLHVETPLPIDRVLRAARRITATGGLILVFSDFDGLTPDSERHIRALARHNDLLLFQVHDPLMRNLPDRARLPISDARQQAELDMGANGQRRAVSDFLDGRLAALAGWSRRYGAPLLQLSTDQPASDQLRRLMGLAEARR